MSWVNEFQTVGAAMLKERPSNTVVELVIFGGLSWSEADERNALAGTSFAIIEDR